MKCIHVMQSWNFSIYINNIIHVPTVTFDQFIASLFTKSINFYKNVYIREWIQMFENS